MLFFAQVKPEDARVIVERHLQCGIEVSRLLYVGTTIKEKVRTQHECRFIKKENVLPAQLRLIDHGKHSGIYRQQRLSCLSKGVDLNDSGSGDLSHETLWLAWSRRRGFPTGRKWEFTKQSQADEKFVICNADEGDPARL
jgi:hypothetical protein